MRRATNRIALTLLLLLSAGSLMANNLMMVRTNQTLDKSEAQLREAISDSGYSIIEGGMGSASPLEMGLVSGEYRFVTLQHSDEATAELLAKQPLLAPFLPWRIALFVENGTTLLITLNPIYLEQQFGDAATQPLLKEWRRVLRNILSEVVDGSY